MYTSTTHYSITSIPPCDVCVILDCFLLPKPHVAQERMRTENMHAPVSFRLHTTTRPAFASFSARKVKARCTVRCKYIWADPPKALVGAEHRSTPTELWHTWIEHHDYRFTRVATKKIGVTPGGCRCVCPKSGSMSSSLCELAGERISVRRTATDYNGSQLRTACTVLATSPRTVSRTLTDLSSPTSGW